MINFNNLSILDSHQSFLQKRSKNQNVFLVGWCVRDLLLGITDNPTDIDFTMAGDPQKLYKSFDKDWLSHFITEKFGTSTFITEPFNYELTPLRTEWNYSDTRHPDQIQRSNDLLLDAKRRDFTINAMYYFSCENTGKELDFTQPTEWSEPLSDEKLLKILAREWYIYFADINLLVLSKTDYISGVFPDAQFDEVFCRYLIETQKTSVILSVSEESIQIKKTPHDHFRILIDPTWWIPSMISRKLETVGNPDQRFWEDALRLIRALRLVNVMNHKLNLQKV